MLRIEMQPLLEKRLSLDPNTSTAHLHSLTLFPAPSLEDCPYLLGIHNVHDDTALQHPGQSRLHCESVLAILSRRAIGGGEFSCHCE